MAPPAGPSFWSWEASSARHPERRESGLKLHKTEATAQVLSRRERLAPLLLLPILLLLGVGSLSVVIRTHSLPGKAYELPLPPPKPEIRFSLESGAYPEDAIQVTVTAPEPYRIACTTDGHRPSLADDCGASTLSLTLEKEDAGTLLRQKDRLLCSLDTPLLESAELPCGRVLRVSLLDPDDRIVASQTRVYFLGADFAARYPGCLVLSVFAEPEDLLDEDRGILVTGAVYSVWEESEAGRDALRQGEWWLYESNATQRGRSWERPCTLQLYDGGNHPVLEQAAGIRVAGGSSRRFSQKSFTLYFRGSYGEKLLRCKLFPGVDAFQSFTLRAGGNNAEGLKYKDCFLQNLVWDRDLLIPYCRPAILFLNGEYWGPYLLREKVSAQMLHDRCGVDRAQVIVIKDGQLEAGRPEDLAAYEALDAFGQKDLSDPQVYADFCRLMDVQSLADYCALRIYIGDGDWFREVNDILWRTRDDSCREGRWQYILHDIGCSAGLYRDESTDVTTDHFQLALENYPLFAAAMQNEDFRLLFLRSLQQICSVDFRPERVEEQLQIWDRTWEPLRSDYYLRFQVSPEAWENEEAATLAFFRARYDLLLQKVLQWYAQFNEVLPD